MKNSETLRVHRLVQPLALEPGLVVAELVRLVVQRQEAGGGGAHAVAAAKPEALAVEEIEHPVVVEVIFRAELEDRVRLLALTRVDAAALEIVRTGRPSGML